MNNITLTWMVAMFYANDAWSNNCFLDTFLNNALRSSEMICVFRLRHSGQPELYLRREIKKVGGKDSCFFLEDILLRNNMLK